MHPSLGQGFAAELRAETAQAHTAAEEAPFAVDLMAGRVSLDGYASYLRQLLEVYSALERPAAVLRCDPIASAFVDPALHRSAALQHDIDHLVAQGCDPGPVFDETVAYTAAIDEAAESWTANWVAHHYTRYLGDLSGGRFLARSVREHLGVGPATGASVFVFDGIGAPGAYKQEYRRKLDVLGASIGPAGRRRFVDEARAAFAANHNLFLALGGATTR